MTASETGPPGIRCIDLSVPLNNFSMDRDAARVFSWAHREGARRVAKMYDIDPDRLPGGMAAASDELTLNSHSGTHLDAPYHFDEHGPAIHALPLERLYARARVLDFTHKKPLEGIGPEDFDAAMGRAGGVLEPGDAMVVWTGHSKNYERPDYASNRPFITAEGADWIVERHPALGLLVTDLIGLDEYVDPVDPVHIRLLMAGIPFVQVTTNLDRLAAGEWFIAAFPLKLVEGTGAPLRVFAAAP